nr:uncharacterized protein LOC132777788 [Anolis sagrei ordinatus]
MSIILSGLIHIFRPLLSSLSGALDCEGLGPWYFLLGLRIVAIFFSNGPWDSVKEDVACNWVAPIEDKSRDFCTTLCHNLHFPFSIAAMWGLVFIALLLLVGLMRLSSPKKKKEDGENGNGNGNGNGKEDKEKGLAIVEKAPHGSNADMSTIYWVGRRGLPRRYGAYRSHPHHPHYLHHYYGHHDNWHDWPDWHGAPGAPMVGEHYPDTGFVPPDVGGYGMPIHQEHISQTKMPEHYHDMAQTKMGAYPKDMRQSNKPTHGPGTEQYAMSSSPGQVRQTRSAPYYGEKGQYSAPTKSIPIPIHGSPHKGKITPRGSPGNEHDETFQQRYTSPNDGTKYSGQSKMVPRYCEDGQYGMASKCRPDIEGSMGHIAVADDSPNMAIKRRPVQGTKIHTKHHANFDAAGRSDMGFVGNTYAQPWMTKNPSGKPAGGKKTMAGPSVGASHGDAACICNDTDPCHMGHKWEVHWEPPCGPCCRAEPTHHEGHGCRGSPPGPQEGAKMSIKKICGVPLFDVWVALLLAMEIGFLCIVLLFQVPTLLGRSWICTPGASGCPQSVECTIKGRAEKRVALWGLVFTSILFIIACSGYFNLRFCWNQRCQQMCSGEESGDEAITEAGKRDEEEGGNENKEGD